MELKDKIGFILSCRAETELALQNDTFYKYVFNEYLNSDIDDVEIEYDFYLFDRTQKMIDYKNSTVKSELSIWEIVGAVSLVLILILLALI